MRLAPTLVLSSLFLPFVSAHARPGGSHHSSQSRSLSRLQYHQPRDLIDLCVNIPETVINVLGPNGLLNIAGPGGLLDGLLGIDLDVCLCIDNLDIYLKASANVTTNGQALAAINALINAADDTNAQCGPLPPHATRKCTTANPCAFDCTAPYTLSSDGTQCVCSSCPSAGARSLKSRRSEIFTYKDAKNYCQKSAGASSEVCGVFDKPGAWECLDVTSNADSCGGRVVDPPFPDRKAARGTDCGGNGEDVKCEKGKCVIQKESPVSTAVTSRDLLGGLLNGLLGGGPPSSDVGSVTQTLSPTLAGPISNVVSSAGALSGSTPASGCLDTSSVSAPLLAVHAILNLNPLTIVADINLAIGQVTSLQQAAQQCGASGSGSTGGNAGGSAGLGGLLKAIGDLLNNLTNLLNACPNGVAPTVPSTSTADAQCLVLNLCALLHGPSTITVCGSLGQTLHGLLQPTVDGLLKTLGLDPATCPKFPSAASAPSVGAPSADGATAPSVSVSRRGLLDGLLGGGSPVSGLLGGGSPLSGVGSTVTQALSPVLAPLISSVVGSAATLSSTAPASGCVNTSSVSAPLLAVHAIVNLNPLTIVADVKLALSQVSALQQTAQQCSGASTSAGAGGATGGNTGGGAGLGGLLGTIGDLLNNLTGLLNAFPNGVAPTVPSTSAADAQCLVLNLCALLHGPSTVTVCGGLGTTLHGLLQPTVDGLLKTLGLDPTTCPKLPAAASGAAGASVGAAAPSVGASASVGVAAPSVSAAASAAVSVPTPSAAVSASGGGKPPPSSGSKPLLDVNLDLNLKRRAFRARHGHFARTDSSHILSPDMTLTMMRALTVTTAITDMHAELPSGCETLLPTLGRLFASSSSSALQTNLVFAASVTQVCKDSLAKSNLDPKSSELVELLLPALVTMRENKSPTVAQSTECPSADNSLPVCRLRMPISDFIRCSCGSQQLPDDTQEILGAIPPTVQCSSVKALPASSVVTRSTVPAAVSPSPNGNVVTAADAVLTATLKINLLGGNMPFKTDAVQNLNSGGMNPLLEVLVGSDLLQAGPTGTLGGEVAKILNGGEDTMTADELNQLVANAVSLAEEAKGDSDCKCSANADKLIATVNQLPALVDNLRDAVSRCACGGTSLLGEISGLLSQNPHVINAFQLLKA
ncbi:hypothetical protein C8R45DRAFT_479690 [Mycena sanguinolenta]|nr:hypothetical protein C8R45DRAFT_479690 [Mycena sanguinolenta]